MTLGGSPADDPRMASTAAIREALRSRRATCGTWLTMADVDVARTLSRCGFAWLVVDMEHGAIDWRDAAVLFGALASSGCVPLCRVASGSHENIKRALDAGALGIIAPMIETVEAAAAVVSACKYPPVGSRSIGPGSHWLNLSGCRSMNDYFARANDEVMVIIQTESPRGIDNAASIYAVAGLDAVLIGPRDLRGQLRTRTPEGRPATDAEFSAAISAAYDAAVHAGVPIGMHVSEASEAVSLARDGWQFFTVGSDRSFLAERAAAVVAALPTTPADAAGVPTTAAAVQY